jgi:hypothetical protein
MLTQTSKPSAQAVVWAMKQQWKKSTVTVVANTGAPHQHISVWRDALKIKLKILEWEAIDSGPVEPRQDSLGQWKKWGGSPSIFKWIKSRSRNWVRSYWYNQPTCRWLYKAACYCCISWIQRQNFETEIIEVTSQLFLFSTTAAFKRHLCHFSNRPPA